MLNILSPMCILNGIQHLLWKATSEHIKNWWYRSEYGKKSYHIIYRCEKQLSCVGILDDLFNVTKSEKLTVTETYQYNVSAHLACDMNIVKTIKKQVLIKPKSSWTNCVILELNSVTSHRIMLFFNF